MFSDHAAGLYDLPTELIEARAGLLRLDEAAAAAQAETRDIAAEQRRLIDATHSAAVAGKTWPDVSSIEKTRAAEVARSDRVQILQTAREELAGALNATIAMQASTVISDYLRPKHDEAVKRFRDLADLVPHDASADQLVGAPEKTRKAWLNLDDAVLDYARVSSAASRLIRLAPPQHDERDEFASMRNLTEIWPAWAGPTWQPKAPPWPTDDDRRRVLWLVSHGADLWLPTAAERDQAWLAKYGQEVEHQRHLRSQARAYSTLGAGQ
jgi:hypothetical protein